MKPSLRLLTLTVCAAMLLGLVGCGVPAVQPSTEASSVPTLPDGTPVYDDAAAWVQQADSLVLHVTASRKTQVAGSTFTSSSQQVISCTGLGSEDAAMVVEAEFDYGDYSSAVTEIFSGGTVYASINGYYFSSAMTVEDFTARYVPAVLLDAALYESVVSNESGTAVVFSGAAALESWLASDIAQLVEASGKAVISPDGKLESSSYTATYTQSNATITDTYTVQLEVPVAIGVVPPEDASVYTPVETLDAIHLSEQAYGYLLQAKTTSSSISESLICQAGATLRTTTVGLHTYGTGSDRLALVDQSISQNSSGETSSYTLEERFENGKYSVSENGEAPTGNDAVTAEVMEEYHQDYLSKNIFSQEYFLTAKGTDTGSTYILEFTGTEDLGDILQAAICYELFQDEEFLNELATDYQTNATELYIAIDKFTGLPTAAGYSYSGSHTIYDTPFALMQDVNQSLDLASLSAYEEITGKTAPETAPEVPATPLFYRVTGSNGEQMWLFGTIHVGDARTGFLPKEINDAFHSSDALAVEFDIDAFEEQIETDDALAAQLATAYTYSDGTTAKDHIKDEALYDAAILLMKASGNYNQNLPYLRPAVWCSSIDNFYLRQGYTLSAEKGVDCRLLRMAKEQNKKIYNIESGLSQIQMLAGYSDGLQEMLLSSSVSADPLEAIQEITDLYESWCQGDEATLRQVIAEDTSDMTEEEQKLYEEYNNAMSVTRNAEMLKTAKSYLSSGEVVFYAVGLAHLLHETGLVDSLRAAGYTVEQVVFE